ncbi:MAG: hypothetical protein U0641_04295 [Anaerolineae bacterium]
MSRPRGMTILAVLAIVGGLSAVFLAGVMPMPFIPPLASGEPMLLASSLVLGGVLSVAFGIATWFTRPWAYWLGVVAGVVMLVATVACLWRGVAVPATSITLLLSAGILYLLIRPQVRRAFALASAPPPAPAPTPKRSGGTSRRRRR